MFRILFLTAAVLLFRLLSATSALAFAVPTHDGLVNDYAGVLSEQYEAELETELQQLAEREGGIEIAVATVTTLEGETVEQVAQQLYDSWQIGKEETDNGVLFLISVVERQVRLHTGYGAEPLLTDAEAGRIIRDQIAPSFQQAAYEQGVRNAISELRQHLTDQTFGNINPINKQPGFLQQFFGTIGFSLLIVFGTSVLSYIAAWFGRSQAWWPGGLVGGIIGTLVGGIPAGIFFGGLGLLLDYILSQNYEYWRSHKKSTNWGSTWGCFHTPGSSGGFRFGGGSSGGGGASGKW